MEAQNLIGGAWLAANYSIEPCSIFYKKNLISQRFAYVEHANQEASSGGNSSLKEMDIGLQQSRAI